MRILYRTVALARALFRHEDLDAGMAEELRFHIERETAANLERGMSLEAARRAARLRVGSVDGALETARDERPGALLLQVTRDLHFGMRLLARSPVFAAAAVIIVALGIGAVTAIFSVVYGVMLRPLPFHEPGRLVSVWTTMPSLDLARLFPTAADVKEWQESNHVFQDIALVRTTANLNLVGSGEPERLQGARLSPNLLPLLGVVPMIGRNFLPAEGRPGEDRVVLLSNGLWKRRFAGDRGIVGRTIQLNGLSYRVIGVMPPEFQYPARDFQAWVPVVVDPRELTREQTENYLAVARLKPGVTLARAQREMDGIARRIAAEFPQTNRDHGVIVEPMLESALRDVRPPLIALLGASACLLLIACINLSNLLGARAAERGGEFAVRLALGASRARVVAQAIAEAVPLLALGGALGVLAATAGVRAFVALSPPGVPRLESIRLSLPVILVAAGLVVATGIAASSIPALHAWRADLSGITKEGGRGATTGRRRSAARRLGVVAQFAFAVPLLAGACLLIRSSIKLGEVELGFDPENVATFQLAVPRTKYASDRDVATFYQRLLERVASLPGVRHAGMVNRLPLAGNQTMSIHVARAPGSVVEISAIDSRPVTPDYFAAMGIALRGGRAFSEFDDSSAAPVAIVDERLARSLWPGQSAIGKRVQRFDAVWCAVVGVVGHIHANAVDVDPRPQVYWPYRQVTQDRMVLVVRSAGAAGAASAAVIRAIHSVDPEQPVYDVRAMTDVVGRSLVPRRLTALLITTFAAIALILSAVGIYGVVAFGVTQRLREFGIRVALGATRREVAGLVLREAASMAALGVLAGLVGALALGGTLSALVFEVAPRDLLSLAAATALLVVVGALASYIPARRASGIDPAVTLRAA